MPDDRPQRARAAAEAGTATRDRKIEEEWNAFWHDSSLAQHSMPGNPKHITPKHLKECGTSLDAAKAHLDELARLIAQRDGYAAAQSIGPDVALKGWGSKR